MSSLRLGFAWKRLFASEESKPILIGLLNLLFRGNKHIVAIEYGKTEYPGENDEEGGAIFDITCTDADGSTFIIEIQRGWQEHFIDRSFANLTREERAMYNTSLKRKWDNKNVMDYAVKTAEQKGLQKGRKELALELAREMLAENEPIDMIVRYTKLPIEEIQSL